MHEVIDGEDPRPRERGVIFLDGKAVAAEEPTSAARMRSSARFTSLVARNTYARRMCARCEKSAGANAPASKAARNSTSLFDNSCFNIGMTSLTLFPPTKPYASSASAICTAFNAAPLRS
jgi:hypothetical protein